MSEYQYVVFKAVDRPLTREELAYARKQSSRAAISPWSFENEYHYGDFGGDVDGLLKRGYDVHLHYANFGIRTIALRLPGGLPFVASSNTWAPKVSSGKEFAVVPAASLRSAPISRAVSLTNIGN